VLSILCAFTQLFYHVLRQFAIDCTFTHCIYTLMYFLPNLVAIPYLTVFSFRLHLCSFIIGLMKTYTRGRN